MLFCSLSLMDLVPVLVILVYLFTVVCRWRVFRRMNIRPWLSLIPVVNSFMIFRRCWKVWPFIFLAALTLIFGFVVQTTAYMDINLPIPTYVKSNMTVLAIVCLMIITILMYKHLAFAFGHDIGYVMGLLFLNPVFLGLLAFSKNTFHEELVGLRGRELKEYTMHNRTLANRILSAVSAVIIVCTSIGYIGYVMMTEHQPGFLISRNLSETYKTTAGKVSGTGEVVYPALEVKSGPDFDVREHYFPDKSHVKETTVYMYLIGSDLEDTTGSASINLAQIKDATEGEKNLKFIIEAGGTDRWFTDGYENGKTGRYMIKDGKITLLETLPSNTSMSKGETLKDFLIWANNNYSSDRKMLFFWDHGGGISGFGVDIVNPGTPKEEKSLLPIRNGERPMLSMDDIRRALNSSGQKYDLIAFDACLMQTMEVGQCLEPFADYLLASEESEPNSGLYYTAAFSRLARQPDLDTLKFGSMMCSSYDQSLELLKGGPQAGYTMSMVDLRYIPVVQETIMSYLDGLDEQFRIDKSSFINMSTARSKAYEFQMEDQIDLIDFINKSDISAAQKEKMINTVKKAVAVRNAASATNINGLAIYMPYDDLYSYSNIYEQMEKLDMKSETKVYNDFASIIGSQKTTKDGKYAGYFKNEDWYVDDFEEYNITLYKQDIPLIKRGNAYEIDLSEEEWESIIGYEQGLKIKVGSRYADLGSSDSYSLDEEGHYMVDFKDKWLAIDGILVAVHPGTTRESEDGETIHSGTVDASLNFMEPITIYVEWTDKGKGKIDGTITGYLPKDQDSDDIDETGMPRGVKQFKASNTVTFLYDWYDKDGNYLTTALGHWPINVGMYGLKLTQKDISSEEYNYYGILRDVLNRESQTETLHHKSH